MITPSPADRRRVAGTWPFSHCCSTRPHGIVCCVASAARRVCPVYFTRVEGHPEGWRCGAAVRGGRRLAAALTLSLREGERGGGGGWGWHAAVAHMGAHPPTPARRAPPPRLATGQRRGRLRGRQCRRRLVRVSCRVQAVPVPLPLPLPLPRAAPFAPPPPRRKSLPPLPAAPPQYRFFTACESAVGAPFSSGQHTRLSPPSPPPPLLLLPPAPRFSCVVCAARRWGRWCEHEDEEG